MSHGMALKGQPATAISLVARARWPFALFCILALGVEVIEFVDAETPLWPRRVVAALGLIGAALWVRACFRGRAPGRWWLDLWLVGTLVLVGWGLGRGGAILTLLLAVLQLRVLYGGRWGAARGAGSAIGAFLLVQILIGGGLHHLWDLGTLTVVSAALGVAVVIRRLIELLARHDVDMACQSVLTDAAIRLGTASDLQEVNDTVTVAQRQAGRVLEDPSLRPLLPPSGRPDRAAQADERLATIAALARERVASESRYRILAEQSGDGIYLLELAPEVRYRYLNPAAGRLLGIPVEQALRDPGAERRLVHPEDHRLLRRLRRQRGLFEDPVQVRVLPPDSDEPRWLEIQERPVDAPEGTRLVMGTLKDVTARREQHQALQRTVQAEQAAARRLRELDELRTTFLQAVSHEMRTPLTSLLGAAETVMAQRRRLTHGQTDQLLESIRRQAHRLEQLLTDLLDVDRLSRSRIEPDRRPTRLLALARRVAAAQDQDSHPIEVRGDDVKVAVDPAKVERIIDNLLRNAVKHTPPGTPIRCTVEPVAEGALLTVEDEGPGVPAELTEQVFEPFVQGPSTDALPSPGTGIGLALVGKLAELHGGRAWVEPRPGGGARFAVLLPGPAVPATQAGVPATDVVPLS